MFKSDLLHVTPSLQHKMQALFALNREKTIDLSFRPPFLDLLKALGDPHLHLPPVVHVAGTNGKGSTIACLKAITEAAGYKVHTYTSPHLVRMNERICIAGREIDDAALESLIDEAVEANAGRSITFFEITTAIAFAAFARHPADLVLLETGLGGRLDCTNIIPAPAACAITSIGFDHMEFLGDTLPKIAAEKAGIIKPGSPCIIGPQNAAAIDAQVMRVFEEHSLKADAPLYTYNASQIGAQWVIEKHADHCRFFFAHKTRRLPLPALIGGHQCENAGTALMICEILQKQGFKIPEAARASGLQNVQWRARLQNVTAPFAGLLPPGCEIFLDGAHNASGAAALAAQAQAWHETDSKPLHLILGMMAHKDPVSFLKPLIAHLSGVRTVPISGEPAAIPANALAATLQKAFKDLHIETASDIAQALGQIAATRQPVRVLIAGSLYLAGQVLKSDRHQAHNKS